jgi:hypothetical protein
MTCIIPELLLPGNNNALKPRNMKFKDYIKCITIIIALITVDQLRTFSQGTDINLGKKPGIYISANAGFNKSQIINEGNQSISKLLSAKGSSVSGLVSFGYVLPGGVGFSAGIGYMPYSTELTLDTYETKYNTKDSENESYERRVSGTAIKEEQSIGFLSFPICINYRIPFSEALGLFIEPGISLAVPLNKEYQSSGTFTYKGYYPAYNVLFENLPAYGFASNKSSNTTGELEIKSMVINLTASAGIEYIIKEKVRLGVGLCYTRSLSDISEYTSPQNFQLTSNEGQLNSFMGGADKVTTSSFGLNVTLRYFIK